MDVTPFVAELRHQVMVAAEAGGEDARLLAERITAVLEAATRLVLLEALSAATAEITTELAPGSVEVRLRGRDPEFVVTSPPSDRFDEVPRPLGAQRAVSSSAPVGDGVEGGASRLTLRLPEQLKTRIEDAAGRDGLSVNAWLVRVVANAVDPTDPGRRVAGRGASGGQRYTGWAR